MKNITTYKRFENESDEELIYRICSDKEQIGSWQDVSDILNEILGYEYTESKYRKQFQAFQKMLNANQAKFADCDAQLQELELKTREFERAKIKFRDERNAWQKQNFIDSRVEQKLDCLEEQLSQISKVDFGTKDDCSVTGDNDLLIILSDFHIGQCFSSIWGEYNSDIAKERLGKLLSNVIKIAERHGSENAYISLQGDLISGSIHKSIAITNRENVIEQVKLASELIASFIDELSPYFKHVFVSSVVGNHTRIDRKDDALHSERLDDLINWAVEKCLIENKKVVFLKHRKLDNGISDISIRGRTYIGVHGDYDAFSKSGVSNLCMFLNYVPEAIVFGHMHVCAVDECNGVKMIRGGSLAGSGDDYTIEKRLSGKPSQMVCVCDNNGVQCYYPIDLS